MKNFKIIKSTVGAYSAGVVLITDSSASNGYVESAGNNSSTYEAIRFYRSTGAGIIVKTAGSSAVRISASSRMNAVTHILAYSTASTTLRAIFIDGYVNNAGMLLDHFTLDGFDDGILFDTGEGAPGAPGHITNGIISGAVDGINTNESTIRTGCSFGNIAFYNNTNNYSAMDDAIVLEPVLCTADPYTDSANGDFSPNNTASGGALLRGATGIGAGIITSNLDIGAIQHADPINPTLAIGI